MQQQALSAIVAWVRLDRAVELFRPKVAVRSQYPMLAVMVAYTVGGLLLLLNA